MATAGSISTDYAVIDDEDSFNKAMCELKTWDPDDLLALHCEGINLNKRGQITNVIVAKRNKILIFDIEACDQFVFNKIIRDILEDKTRDMLMFDCRNSADCFWKNCNVNLRGTLDLQLLEVIFRQGKPMTHGSGKASAATYTSQEEDDVQQIKGFLQCVELYVIENESIVGNIKKGLHLAKRDKYVWKKRSLALTLQHYLCAHINGMFRLYDALKANEAELPRLRGASEQYADIFRLKPQRTYNEFENNMFLPLNIIPKKESLSCAVGNTVCVACDRRFRREEFSKNQLKQGLQKCQVCKKVKLDMDVRKNRLANFERKRIQPRSYEDEDPYSDTDNMYGSNDEASADPFLEQYPDIADFYDIDDGDDYYTDTI